MSNFKNLFLDLADETIKIKRCPNFLSDTIADASVTSFINIFTLWLWQAESGIA